jgi:Ca2+-binding EF-hand superfamily protein
MTRYVVALVGMSLVLGTTSHSALAQGRTNQASEEGLMRQMDADRNGVVSREEYMNYHARRFDQLDVNRNGQLERNELRRYYRNRDPHNDR